MIKSIKKILSEKGQGLTEYVLILAFIAGISMMFTGGGLKSTLVNTFNETNEILAGLFNDENKYAAMLEKYGKAGRKSLVNLSWTNSTNYTMGDDIVPNADRIAADEAALENLANLFMGMDVKDVKEKIFINEGLGNQYFNGTAINLGKYSDHNSVENPGSEKEVLTNYQMNGRRYTRDEMAHWLQGDYGNIKSTSGSYTTNGYDTESRYFFSNGMIDPNGSDSEIFAKITSTDNKVTGVTVYTVRKGETIVSKTVP